VVIVVGVEAVGGGVKGDGVGEASKILETKIQTFSTVQLYLVLSLTVYF
jgi:hypothetical protein